MMVLSGLLRDIWILIRDSVKAWSEDRASRLAAALAYYAVFSIAPLLIIAIAVIGFIVGERIIRAELVRELEGLLGRDVAEFVQRMVASVGNATSGILASIIGGVTLLLGASGLFGQLQGALNTVWNVPRRSGVRHLLRQRLVQFLMVLAICALLLLSLVSNVVVTAVTTYLSIDSHLAQINLLASFVLLTVMFAAAYKLLPDIRIGWRDVWIGAVVTSLLFGMGKWAIGLYMARSSVGSAYGAAGSLVIFLVWVYYSAQIILLGAEFTHVYAVRFGSLRGASGVSGDAEGTMGLGKDDETPTEVSGIAAEVGLSPDIRAQILRFQRNEITEYHIYRGLAESVASRENRAILERVAGDELRHYHEWKRRTGADVPPDRWATFRYLAMGRLLGFTFAVKLMERGEESAQGNYASLIQVVPEAEAIMHDESNHEDALLAMLDEERLRYTGSMVLGLSDALVELTGTLAGLTLALQNTQLIALSVSITGIAAALSMSASEYLSTKADAGERHPGKAALYTGVAYIFAVLLLVLPYLFLSNYFLCLAVSLILAILVIAGFSFYVGVARGESFRTRFLEMAGLTLGVAGLSFLIGLVVRQLFGIEI